MSCNTHLGILSSCTHLLVKRSRVMILCNRYHCTWKLNIKLNAWSLNIQTDFCCYDKKINCADNIAIAFSWCVISYYVPTDVANCLVEYIVFIDCYIVWYRCHKTHFIWWNPLLNIQYNCAYSDASCSTGSMLSLLGTDPYVQNIS